jgi:hypothetical protein
VSYFYDKCKEEWAKGRNGANGVDFVGDTIKLVLVDLGVYTPNKATDEFLTAIPGGARVSTTLALTGKTNVGGVLDADDTSFPGTAAGTTCAAFVVYQDTGVAATSRLIALVDTATGLPVVTDGAAITCAFPAGNPKLGQI